MLRNGPSTDHVSLTPTVDTPDVAALGGYRYRPAEGARPNAWYRDCAVDELPEERAWLAGIAYVGRADGARVEKITGRERYSARA